MYEEDLLWVWRGWVASIIELTENSALKPRDPLSGPRGQISGYGGILMTTSHCSRCFALYIYIYSRPAMSMNWIWCPNHNLQHIACEKPSESPITYHLLRYCHHEVRPSVGVASVWPLTTVEGAEILYIRMRQTCCEYDLGGLPQSQPITWYIWCWWMLRLRHTKSYQATPTDTERPDIQCGFNLLGHTVHPMYVKLLYKLEMEWMWYSGWDGPRFILY